MSMTTISVNCTDQTLTVERNPALTTGGVSVDRIAFTFCPLWDDYQKTAVFYRSADQVFHVLLDADDTAVVPQEVLRTPGFLFFGVFGVKGSSVRPSEILRYTVRDGAISDSTAVPDPTPDIYAQLLDRIGDLAKLKTLDKSSLVAAINELHATGGGGSGGGGMYFELDKTLRLEDGVLGVNTANRVEADNTLPITAAAVHTTVGNIEVLLSTI